jgi:hypothetical protein
MTIRGGEGVRREGKWEGGMKKREYINAFLLYSWDG